MCTANNNLFGAFDSHILKKRRPGALLQNNPKSCRGLVRI